MRPTCFVYAITLLALMAALGQASDIGINSGGLAVASGFEAAAAAHFCASVPASRTFGAAEFVFGAGVLGDDPLIAEGGFTIKDGSVAMPTGPGLGMVLNEDALKRMTLSHSVVTA